MTLCAVVLLEKQYNITMTKSIQEKNGQSNEETLVMNINWNK
jgi:hypothetical protein